MEDSMLAVDDAYSYRMRGNRTRRRVREPLGARSSAFDSGNVAFPVRRFPRALRYSIVAVSSFIYLVVVPPAFAEWILVDTNSSGIRALWRTETVGVDTVRLESSPSAPEQTAILLRIDDAEPNGAIGAPALPEASILVAVPNGARATAFGIPASTETLRGLLAPMPMPEGVEDVRGVRAVYRIDPDAYASPEERSLVSVEKTGSEMGTDLYRLTISPVRYTPEGNRITVAKAVDVRIVFGADTPIGTRRRGPALPSFWRSAVLNYDQASQWTYSETATRVARKTAEPSPFASGTWLRAMVSQTGVYRLSAAEIIAADTRFRDAPLNRIAMFTGPGIELPISPVVSYEPRLATVRPLVSDMNNDGLLNGTDEILFYGRSPNRWRQKRTGNLAVEYVANRYTSENVYWIGIVDSTAHHATTLDGAVTSSGLPVIDSYPFRTRAGQDTRNFNEASYSALQPDGAESGLDWEWQQIPMLGNLPISIGLTDAANGTVWFSLGELRTEGSNCRYMSIELNGAPVTAQSQRTDGFFGYRQEFVTTVDPLASAELNVRIVNTNSTCGDPGSLDYYEVQYLRRLRVPSNAESFPFSVAPRYDLGADESVEMHITGVDRTTHRLFEVTESAFAEITIPAPESGVTTLQLTRSGITEREYVLVKDQTWKSPSRILSVRPRGDLVSGTDGVDYVIVTHETFVEDAARLASWRTENNGFRTLVATTRDIYDQFSAGLYDPGAIRAFLRHVWERRRDDPNSPTLQYVLLMGDGHYNFRNINRPRQSESDPHADNWVPTYQEGVIMTDDWFGTFSTGPVPQLMLGRLAVRTPNDSRTVVDKIIQYEDGTDRGAWQNRALLVADDNYNPETGALQEPFTVNSEDVAKTLRPETVARKIYGVEYAMDAQGRKPTAARDLVTAWNEGALLINYIGHGAPTLWAHERMFELSSDLSKLNNRRRLPILTALTCSAGHFDHPETQSMSEVLTNAPNGGAIAVIAATRLVFNVYNIPFDTLVVKELYRGADRRPRIGDAFWATKAKMLVGASNSNTRRFVLIGDPAMTVALPELPVEVSVDRDSLVALQPVTVFGRVLTPDSTATLTSFTGEALVHLFDSDTRARFVPPLNLPTPQHYVRPGQTLYRGIVPVSNGQFEIEAIIPKEVTYGASEARAVVQIWNDQIDGAGGLQGVPIDTAFASTEIDTVGPTVFFTLTAVNGAPSISDALADGAEIARGEPLRVWLSDPSGINVTGGIGHRLTARTDVGTEPVDITNEFTHRGGATLGYADVSLADDRSVQKVTVRAWDNRNNTSIDSIVVRLGQRESVRLRNVIAYPNPMPNNETTFTWITEGLGDDLADATVRIYSVAGRLVDTLTLIDITDGPVLLPWRPERSLANGVYLYQITVRRQSDGHSTRVIERLAVLGS